jgi:hypothetical protein
MSKPPLEGIFFSLHGRTCSFPEIGSERLLFNPWRLPLGDAMLVVKNFLGEPTLVRNAFNQTQWYQNELPRLDLLGRLPSLLLSTSLASLEIGRTIHCWVKKVPAWLDADQPFFPPLPCSPIEQQCLQKCEGLQLMMQNLVGSLGCSELHDQILFKAAMFFADDVLQASAQHHRDIVEAGVTCSR